MPPRKKNLLTDPPVKTKILSTPYNTIGTVPNGITGGTQKKLQAEFLSHIGEDQPRQLARRIIDLAINGSPKSSLTAHAMRLAAERLWPAMKNTEMRVEKKEGSESAEKAKEIASKLTKDQLETLRGLLDKPTLQ